MIESSQTLDSKSLTSEIHKLCKMFPTPMPTKAKTKTKNKIKTNKISKRKSTEPVKQPEKKPNKDQCELKIIEVSDS